ncbi:MotA/TolQ/ExbB proton channel family protein [Novosphingobium piscinae]|uniref:MotA/TolQ/ExbB proton channel family protein n=1 Tax=Novosphingobium piscinae TaxID=1507448 RepID=A0A7X1KR60_9SPHN|nr:MotA/TolQ/ExbB proton channel family protein [Novosphingobium piscinae]MBC2670454.1 MotA/TolQ/ExbB proton channel family protein [Novosphingobium piscinae]
MALTLIDGTAALIVFGGTALATVLRCGLREVAATARALARAWGPGYSADAGRAELAPQVREIRAEGLLRAHPRKLDDRDLAEATEVLFHTRSLEALVKAHARHSMARRAEAETGVRVLAQASELAPVFGMAGTLVALNRMPADLATGDAVTGAIGMAVVTTLYGILAANLVLAPLARWVERAAEREERERQVVIDWLSEQVGAVLPPPRDGRGEPRPEPRSEPRRVA